MNGNKGEKSANENRYSVICHNDRKMIRGVLLDANSAGCDIASDSDAVFPAFSLKSAVILNILDVERRSSVNVIGKAVEVRRENELWIYSFSWARKPAMLCVPNRTREKPADGQRKIVPMGNQWAEKPVIEG